MLCVSFVAVLIAACDSDPFGSVGPAECINGDANGYACSGIDLRKRVPLDAMAGAWIHDIWGWADTLTGNEYAMIVMTGGTAFVDITRPENPVYLGLLPTENVDGEHRDVKVFEDHAYIVAEKGGANGMLVFDLTRLRGLTTQQSFTPDAVYPDFESSHNIAINEDSGFLYAVLTGTCGNGLHIVDVSTPGDPLFAGCHSPSRTHDTQSVIYQGPDADYLGREICISSNEDHLEVVDVTDKFSPITISTSTYPDLRYVHQGWLTEDQRFFLFGDDADELDLGVPTRTHVFDLADLDAPIYVFAYEAQTVAIDHNQYVLGNRTFQANHTAGLRVLEFGDLANRELVEVAFFDTQPYRAGAENLGARSVYPYLPSGNIIVADRNFGLFIFSLQ